MPYKFSVIRLLRLPWLPFILASLAFIVWSIVDRNIDGILLGLAAVLIFSCFHSISRNAQATLEVNAVDIKFGYLAHFQVPYETIASVQPVSQSQLYGLGIRYVGKKTFAFVSDIQNIVEIRFVEGKTITFKVLLFRARPRAIRLSLQNPQTFIKEVENRLPTG